MEFAQNAISFMPMGFDQDGHDEEPCEYLVRRMRCISDKNFRLTRCMPFQWLEVIACIWIPERWKFGKKLELWLHYLLATLAKKKDSPKMYHSICSCTSQPLPIGRKLYATDAFTMGVKGTSEFVVGLWALFRRTGLSVFGEVLENRFCGVFRLYCRIYHINGHAVVEIWRWYIRKDRWGWIWIGGDYTCWYLMCFGCELAGNLAWLPWTGQ